MATITYTTTAAQDTALAWERQRINTQRADQGLPALTAAQFGQALIDEAVARVADRYSRDRKTTIRDAYAAATPEQRAQIEAILGVS
jgi:hypothetical protein